MSQVRATRAYIAGFGTAGSLLAGAAVMFVLASAVVSFRGWPQVGGQPSAPTVLVAARHARRPAPARAGRDGGDRRDRRDRRGRRDRRDRGRGHGHLDATAVLTSVMWLELWRRDRDRPIGERSGHERRRRGHHHLGDERRRRRRVGRRSDGQRFARRSLVRASACSMNRRLTACSSPSCWTERW